MLNRRPGSLSGNGKDAAPPPEGPRQFNLADWILLTLLCTFLFSLCILRSRSRLLWADELYGYRVLGAPTVGGMLQGWWQGADGGGLLYYLLGRLWVQIFGLSELTLRLFSTASMAVALVLLWTTARRFCSTLVTAVSVGFVFLTPAVMLWQELNGRFYGLFLASASLACLMFLITAEAKPGPLDLPLTALAHATLIGSHILGLVYSFALLCGMVAFDLFHRRLRWRLYLAALFAWLLVLLSFHAIHSSSSIAQGLFWTHRPRPFDLLPAWAAFGTLTGPLLVCSWILAGLAALLFHNRRRALLHQLTNQPVLFLLGSLALAQLILYFKSQTGTSIYSDRYLLPLAIGTVLLFGVSLSVLLPLSAASGKTLGLQFSLALLALLPLCAFALFRKTNYALYPPTGYPEQIAARIPAGAPVLTALPAFTLLSHYDPTHRYLFLLDWPFDLAPGHLADYSGERLMENWQRAGYNADRILPCPILFARFPDLYVLLSGHRAQWFNERLLHNPAYTVSHVADFSDWQALSLWSVHRNAPGPPPC